MKTFPITFFAAFLLLAFLHLSAQVNPLANVYYGPYLQEHADQFKGNWTRSDGNFRLRISANEDGGLQAVYANPSPINVESTTVLEEGNMLILEVVLRDTGYPGSYYELEYLPRYRVLHGLYTIPGQQPAEIYFIK